MWPALAAIGGSIIGGLMGQKGQEQTNEMNMAIATKQMDFQREMSNTSYQRGVKDMEAAGLNPMLAYSQGGASSPAGAAIPVQNVAAAAMNSASAGMQMAQGVQQILSSRASVEQTQATTDKIRSETMEHDLNSAYLASQVGLNRNTAAKVFEQILGERYSSQSAQMAYRANMNDPEMAGTSFAADVAKRKAEARLAELEIPRSQAEAKFYGDAGRAAPYIQLLLQGAKATSALGALRP